MKMNMYVMAVVVMVASCGLYAASGASLKNVSAGDLKVAGVYGKGNDAVRESYTIPKNAVIAFDLYKDVDGKKVRITGLEWGDNGKQDLSQKSDGQIANFSKDVQ